MESPNQNSESKGLNAKENVYRAQKVQHLMDAGVNYEAAVMAVLQDEGIDDQAVIDTTLLQLKKFLQEVPPEVDRSIRPKKNSKVPDYMIRDAKRADWLNKID